MGTISDAQSQLSNIYKTLADYNTSLSAAVQDLSGAVEYPIFKDTAQFIDYSELLINSRANQGSMPRYSSGASTESVHHAVAVLREESLCLMGKSNYITLQSSEALSEAAYYSKQGIFMSSTLLGNSTGASVA